MTATTQSIANDCFVVCLFLFICVFIYFCIYLSVCVFVFNIASENLVKELRKLLHLFVFLNLIVLFILLTCILDIEQICKEKFLF